MSEDLSIKNDNKRSSVRAVADRLRNDARNRGLIDGYHVLDEAGVTGPAPKGGVEVNDEVSEPDEDDDEDSE